jgi:hypothetical protein
MLPSSDSKWVVIIAVISNAEISSGADITSNHYGLNNVFICMGKINL